MVGRLDTITNIERHVNMKTSVKESSTAFIDTVAVNDITPFDIIAALEETFLKGEEVKHVPLHRDSMTAEELVEEVNQLERLHNEALRSRAEKLYLETFGIYPSKEREAAEKRVKAPTMEKFYGEQFTVGKMEIFPNKWITTDAEIEAYIKQAKVVAVDSQCEDPSLEKDLCKLNHSLQRTESIRSWIKEQNRHQEPCEYKVVEDRVFELPPAIRRHRISKVNSKGVNRKFTVPNALAAKALRRGWELNGAYCPNSHEPAFYSTIGKQGTVIDLSKPHGVLKPILSTNPASAFNRFASRMKLTKKAGDTEMLNYFLGEKQVLHEDDNGIVSSEYKYLPSYVSEKRDGVWFVRVGWRLNPKVTPSSYWLDENNKLTQQNPKSGEAALTLSQLDYQLLTESSDLAVEDESGHVVEFMNEEEEFLTMFPQRETGETFIDYSKYAEDDDELELFYACSELVESSETGITIGDLESKTFQDAIQHGMDEAKLKIQEILQGANSEENLVELEMLKLKFAKFERLEEKWHKFVGKTVTVVKYDGFDVEFVNDYSAPFKPTTYGCERENASKEKVKVIANAHILPDNHIEVVTQSITEVDRIQPSHNPLELLQKGMTRVVATSSGYSTRIAPKHVPVHTTWENASLKLKATLMRIALTDAIA
jgi:hypothetical protein